MWWEYLIVIVVVGGAVAAYVHRLRKTLRGKAECDAGCDRCCAELEHLRETFGEEAGSCQTPSCEKRSETSA